jgi:mono/diheme cytochrome c family protein
MPAAQAVDPPPPGEYRVVGGKVDRGTFTGWRLFHSACHGCHGVGGVGTDLAPDLLERVRTMTPRTFAARVITSYGLVRPANGNAEERSASREALLDEVMRRDRRARGQVAMPAWEDDAVVPPHVLDLYAYLTARADGKLGAGKPTVLPAPAARKLK